MSTAVPPLSDSALNATLAVFEAYQAARLDFSQEIAKLAATGDKHTVGSHEVDGAEKVLQALEACDTLTGDMVGLLEDLAPSVRQSAMIALGRCCGLSQPLRGKVLDRGVVHQIVSVLRSGGSAALMRAALFFLYSTTNNSADAARQAVELHALPVLCERLELIDPNAKADAVWCLAAIARHDASLANAVAQSGALPLLTLCFKEPSLPLKRISLSAVGVIAQHGPDQASLLLEAGLVAAALPLLKQRDQLVRRHAARLLAVTLQHTEDVSWLPADTAEHALGCLGSASAGDPETASFGAALVGQLARRSPQAASRLVELGAPDLIAAHLATTANPLPGAIGLAHLCDAFRAAASASIDAGALASLIAFLDARPPSPAHVAVAVSTAIGAIANASEATANTVAKSGALQAMVERTLLAKRRPPAEALILARAAIIKALERCTEYEPLMALLDQMPIVASEDSVPQLTRSMTALSCVSTTSRAATGAATSASGVQVALVKALTSAMTRNGNCRYDFLQRGALTRVQEGLQGDSQLREAVRGLNAAFPQQMIDATDPNYEKKLLATLKDS